ncbi:MAG: hypothetical protein CL512_05825 [Actinobacteria bacterium]|nr:hypothetical protein [Actinomycetota bacterium]
MPEKNLHKRPVSYRITYVSDNWSEKSRRYYNVYHSSEALRDLCYSFIRGKIHARSITIHSIEEWDRFAYEWQDRTDIAFDHTEEIRGVIIQNKKIRRKK